MNGRKTTDGYLLKSPIGVLEIREENGRITRLGLKPAGESNGEPENGSGMHSDLMYETYKQLNEYFAGKRKSFDLPIAYTGTPFQQSVWGALRNIPYGERRSYADIAVNIGNPKAVRAVGQANRRNHIIILVPCHRVINKDGSLGGFGCGAAVKKYLLDLEKENMEIM